MQEGYYCGGSGAGRTEGVLVSKTSREWCGVKDWPLGHGVFKIGAVQDIFGLGREYCGSVETEAGL